MPWAAYDHRSTTRIGRIDDERSNAPGRGRPRSSISKNTDVDVDRAVSRYVLADTRSDDLTLSQYRSSERLTDLERNSCSMIRPQR